MQPHQLLFQSLDDPTPFLRKTDPQIQVYSTSVLIAIEKNYLVSGKHYILNYITASQWLSITQVMLLYKYLKSPLICNNIFPIK